MRKVVSYFGDKKFFHDLLRDKILSLCTVHCLLFCLLPRTVFKSKNLFTMCEKLDKKCRSFISGDTDTRLRFHLNS